MSFTPEQEELRATVARALAAPGDRPLWTVLTAEIGATALAIPEEYGGFGASLIEVGIVLEEAGAALLPGPYLSTVVGAALLAGPVLEPLASGDRVAAVALSALPGCTATPDGDGYTVRGEQQLVLDGVHADVFVVLASASGEPALFVTDQATVVAQPTLDQTRSLATVTFLDAPATRLAATPERALALARTALAVESVGVARASLARTIAYLRDRRQFGQPLASFQALRHRVADLAVAVEAATSSAWYALRALADADADPHEVAVGSRIAKLVATEAAYSVTRESIQLHGGIGFTWEHPAHRYLKRATTNRQLFGDPVTLRREIGTLAGI